MNLRGNIKRLSFLAVTTIFLLVGSLATSGQVLVGYDFTAPSSAPATFAPTTTAANVNSSNLTRGAGAPASTATNSFRTTGFQNNGISTANTDYFQTTVSATAGFNLSLSSLTAILAGTTSFAADPGVTSQFAYSLNGTNFTLIGSPQTIIGTPQNLTVDTTGVAALQNVPSGTTITLRYYASGQTTTGGWGFNSPSAGTNGFAINGTSLSPTAAGTTAGGRVTESSGRGIFRALVTMTDASGNQRFAYTNQLGYFQFEDVAGGQVYVFTAQHRRFMFDQPTQVQFIGEEQDGINFTGTTNGIFKTDIRDMPIKGVR